MFYLKLYYNGGLVRLQNSRSLAYAKREADLLRADASEGLEKIEIICSGDNEQDDIIIEAFYIGKGKTN